MNTIQAIAENPVKSNTLFSVSPIRSQYLWKNLVIEKRISSTGWSRKKRSNNIFHAFWSVVSSPVS